MLPNAKDSTFALPNAKNTNMLVPLALGDANFLRWPCTFHILCGLATQHEPNFQWSIGGGGSPTQNSCVGHVHFILFVSISFAFGSRRKPSFQWNMGFRYPKPHTLHVTHKHAVQRIRRPIVAPTFKPVPSSQSYQQAIYEKYDRRGLHRLVGMGLCGLKARTKPILTGSAL